MNPQEKIETFKNELDLIQSEKVKNLVKLALIKTNDKFFEVPASSTGKYHPNFASEKGGLVKHTKVAVLYGNFIINVECSNVHDDEKDLVIAALILHDSCKSGVNFENKYTAFTHPLLVEELLINDLKGSTLELWKKINKLIVSHMGQWNTSKKDKEVLPKPETKLQKIVHIADYLASRKEIGDIAVWLQEH